MKFAATTSFGVVLLTLTLAAGCAKKNIDPGDPRTDRNLGGSLDIGEANAAMQPIYFDFDTYTVRDSERDKIKRAAEFLKASGATIKGVLLEGHADDRGSSDYNFVLGQKRADSVKDTMAAVGIATSSIDTVSYGEEFPVVVGTAETSWAQNRRVEFVLLTDDADANATNKKRRKK